MSNEQWPNPGNAATDFFYQGNKTEFSSTSNPASLWGLRIYNISSITDTMSFSVGLTAVAARNIQMHLVSQVPFTTTSPHYNLRGVRIKSINDDNKRIRGVNNKSLTSGVFLIKNQK